jgi:hypothetical protein
MTFPPPIRATAAPERSATMRRPLDSYRVTGDTKEHASYGVGPATDYGAPNGKILPIGTPVKAPFPLARVERWGLRYDDDFPGGLAINAFSKDGRFQFVGQHLDGWKDHPGLDEGDVIAFSGNTGPRTTGPHLHCYVVELKTGIRLSMEEFMAKHGASPAAPAKPATGHAIRTVKRGVNGRSTPTLSGRIVQYLNPGTGGTFNGFIRGASVTQNGITSNIWYRGAFNGNYFWAGNFTTQSTAGLADLGTYRAAAAPKPPVKPAPLKVHLKDPWFRFGSAHAAINAPRGHRGPTIPAGSYVVTGRSGGATRVSTKWGQVWLHPKAAAFIR